MEIFQKIKCDIRNYQFSFDLPILNVNADTPITITAKQIIKSDKHEIVVLFFDLFSILESTSCIPISQNKPSDCLFCGGNDGSVEADTMISFLNRWCWCCFLLSNVNDGIIGS